MMRHTLANQRPANLVSRRLQSEDNNKEIKQARKDAMLCALGK